MNHVQILKEKYVRLLEALKTLDEDPPEIPNTADEDLLKTLKTPDEDLPETSNTPARLNLCDFFCCTKRNTDREICAQEIHGSQEISELKNKLTAAIRLLTKRGELSNDTLGGYEASLILAPQYKIQDWIREGKHSDLIRRYDDELVNGVNALLEEASELYRCDSTPGGMDTKIPLKNSDTTVGSIEQHGSSHTEDYWYSGSESKLQRPKVLYSINPEWKDRDIFVKKLRAIEYFIKKIDYFKNLMLNAQAYNFDGIPEIVKYRDGKFSYNFSGVVTTWSQDIMHSVTDHNVVPSNTFYNIVMNFQPPVKLIAVLSTDLYEEYRKLGLHKQILKKQYEDLLKTLKTPDEGLLETPSTPARSNLCHFFYCPKRNTSRETYAQEIHGSQEISELKNKLTAAIGLLNQSSKLKNGTFKPCESKVMLDPIYKILDLRSNEKHSDLIESYDNALVNKINTLLEEASESYCFDSTSSGMYNEIPTKNSDATFGSIEQYGSSHREGYWYPESEYERQRPKVLYSINPEWKDRDRFVEKLRTIEDLLEKIDYIRSIMANEKRYNFDGIPQIQKFRGYSECRLCTKHNNGNAEFNYSFSEVLTTWPQGLMHYVVDHNVVPSDTFYNMVMNCKPLAKRVALLSTDLDNEDGIVGARPGSTQPLLPLPYVSKLK